MPSFIVTSPSGKKYRVDGPAGSTREQAIAYAQQLEAEEARRSKEDEDKRGIYPGFARGTRQLASDIQTAVGSISGGEEAALAGIERGEQIARERGTGTSLEDLKREYAKEGVLGAAGEVARSIPEEIAAQAPQIAATVASGAAGAAAGAALGGPAAPITGVVGGAIGALTPSYLQAYAANLERQAQEDIAAGREVDVSRAAAAATAVPQAALDLASQFLVVGRIVGKRVFGEATEEVYNLLRKGDRAKAERVAREGLTKTLAKGTAVGVAAEVPTEVVQSALERAQAGLSITSDDAFKEYGEAAYKAGLAAPLGAVGRYSERSAARREVAAAEPDLTQETEQERIDAEKEREREAAPPPPPVPSSLDEAPPELRTKLRELDSPKKAAEELRDSEMYLARLSELLADAEGLEETARQVGKDPIEMEERFIARADSLKNAIPFIRLRLQELSGTPTASAPTAPVSSIPQANTQQNLQIDQAVAKGLGLPGADTAPKDQPFNVNVGPVGAIPQVAGAQQGLGLPEITATVTPPEPIESTEPPEPVRPISQEAGGQQSLGMESTAVVDPLYEQAVAAVIRTGSPTIPTLQRELQVGFNRAARLIEQMQIEGVVTPKDRETGQRQITMGQRQEAPSATAETAPRVAEQAELEPVGGGVTVPPSGPEPTGRVAEVPAGEGLGAAPRVAADVAPREGRVEPALGELPQITEARPTPTVFTERVKPSLDEIFTEKPSDKTFNEIEALKKQALSLLVGKYGKRPAEGSEKRRQYDAIQQRIAELIRQWGRQVSKEKAATQTAPKRRGQVPPSPVMARQDVETAANESVQGWTNAPEIVVLDNENDARVPRGVKINADDKGFYHEGKTYVLANRASDKADVHATVFHESLGHFGLKHKFKNSLNKMLNDIYETNPAVRAIADTMKLPGMTNAQAVEEVLAIKSEAGPIKEAGIRAAFNRVAAFVRRVGRAMGIKFKYSNNDIAQIVRLGQEKVVKGKREVAGVTSVQMAKKIERDLLEIPVKKLFAVGQKITPFKILTPENAELTLAFFEQLGDSFRPFFLRLRNMQELSDVFGQKIPAIKPLMRLVERRVTTMRERRDQIANDLARWNDTLSEDKYPKSVLDRFYDVALESTERQVDLRKKIKLKNGNMVPNPDYNSLDPLTGKFDSLPQELQDTYFDILDTYRKMGDEYIQLITKNLPPTAANMIRKEIESRRLKVYLPLFREGEYWVRYEDSKGETYVEAFTNRVARQQAITQLNKAGFKNTQPYEKVEKIFETDGAGSYGFFNRVNSELDKYYKNQFGPNAKVPGELKQTLYKLFLDTIPASSVRQQFRKREGYKGAKKDLLRVYATVGSRMANQLTNLEFAPQFDEVNKLVEEDVAKDGSKAMQQVKNELDLRMNFFRDPTDSKWINRAVFVSYADFIMGNISSAAANTTNLPMVVYPMLGGEYGYKKASDVMQDTMAMFFQGGWDTNGRPNVKKGFPYSDRTMFDPSKIPPNSPFGRLFEEAIKQGALKHSASYDIMDARDREARLSDYMGKWNYSKQFLGWIFQNTERFNREVTLASAFRLEMEKLRSQGRTGRAAEKAAIDKAIRLASESNGETLTELGPRVFQSGPLKVFLTFKRFARAMYALQLRLFRDVLVGTKTDTTGMSPQDKAEAEAADREFRKVAFKQWLGTIGGAFTFAGVQGLPFYGAATALSAGASAIMGGMFDDPDDEIEDDEENFKQSMAAWAFRGPVNQIFGIDMASRTGFNGMFWRDDPERVEKIGLELFALEQLMGPTYASLRTRADAIRDFYDGYMDRGLEKLMPVAARNIAKGIRYYTDGVLTKDGKKIVDDITGYENLMQIFGFTPTKISEASARSGARKQIVDRVIERRQALFQNAYAEWSTGDIEGYRQALEDISKWNKTKTAAEFNATINWDELEQSFRKRSKAAEEALDGMTIPKRYVDGAISRVPLGD
jgi:hypothetical protein